MGRCNPTCRSWSRTTAVCFHRLSRVAPSPRRRSTTSRSTSVNLSMQRVAHPRTPTGLAVAGGTEESNQFRYAGADWKVTKDLDAAVLPRESGRLLQAKLLRPRARLLPISNNQFFKTGICATSTAAPTARMVMRVIASTTTVVTPRPRARLIIDLERHVHLHLGWQRSGRSSACLR